MSAKENCKLYLKDPYTDKTMYYWFYFGYEAICFAVDAYDAMEGLEVLLDHWRKTDSYHAFWGEIGDEEYDECTPEYRVDVDPGCYVCDLIQIDEGPNENKRR